LRDQRIHHHSDLGEQNDQVEATAYPSVKSPLFHVSGEGLGVR
jgi:hypothetical protein